MVGESDPIKLETIAPMQCATNNDRQLTHKNMNTINDVVLYL